MTKGCKIWLWIILIGNTLSCLLGFTLFKTNVKIGVYTVVAGVVMIVGISLLLFKQKKYGFYIIAATDVVGIIVNVISGINIIFSLISAGISLAITYYFINKNSDVIK